MAETIDFMRRGVHTHEEVREGDTVSAFQWNRMVDAHNRRDAAGIDAPRQLPNQGEGELGEIFQRFKIEGIEDDFLICSPWDGFNASTEFVDVARPPLLRASITSHGAVTYVKVDSVTLTASAAGEDDETLVVVPSFQVDDEIFGFRSPRGTGVFNLANTEIEWIDLNLDARAWAKEAS